MKNTEALFDTRILTKGHAEIIIPVRHNRVNEDENMHHQLVMGVLTII
jgi:hypothetical protein